MSASAIVPCRHTPTPGSRRQESTGVELRRFLSESFLSFSIFGPVWTASWQGINPVASLWRAALSSIRDYISRIGTSETLVSPYRDMLKISELVGLDDIRSEQIKHSRSVHEADGNVVDRDLIP